ncbi:MAG: polysaccharide pyruvyl transferase family protein [Bacteroidales bacterium]|jgi:pyruvyltransferase|nr:polysaccharide pyruvyl transferase family protein [Bacteroidales bacterium]
MIKIHDKQYKTSSNIILDDGKIPLTFWKVKPNFGDLLSPYLIEKLSSKEIKYVHLKTRSSLKFVFKKLFKSPTSYFAVGSIIRRINSNSIVWGSGAFGTEVVKDFDSQAKILSVRGPLTRNLLRIYGIDCPVVYGDPALLIPKVYNPRVEKKYKIGVILRWAENNWDKANFGADVKKINMSSTNIEETLKEILECENILSSSLHGIILADAYGIPSAWLDSTTPKGLHFKFYDYFLSVEKVQKPQKFDFSVEHIGCKEIEHKIKFDSRKIVFDYDKLLNACPFLEAY